MEFHRQASASTGKFARRRCFPGFSNLQFEIRTSFDLHVPSGVDYPMALVISNTTTNPHFRTQVGQSL